MPHDSAEIVVFQCKMSWSEFWQHHF